MFKVICKKYFLIPLLLTLTFSIKCGAEEITGRPVPWQVTFQPASSPVMHQLTEFHNMMLAILAVIGISVIFLILFTIWRFRSKANPTPAKWSHNTLLEIVWTLLPVVILAFIAYPSFRLLYYMDSTPHPDLTIKAIGKQWYWTYEYPDHGNFSFDSYMIPDKEIQPGQHRLLSVDNPIYVPVGKKVRILTTSNDVIHSWALPSMGVKRDCVPGRINETWFMADKPGTYFGQCSELCGPKHGMMPIEVRALSEQDFNKWVQAARKKFE